ncbi:MAG: 2OG-Fe dioxygenase family protein [Burkholderiales bacterium]
MSFAPTVPAAHAAAPALPGPLWLNDPADAPALLQHSGYALLRPEALTQLASAELPTLAALSPCWNRLPPDAHLKDGGRYRHRRHGSFVQDLATGTVTAVPHRAHWQPTTYNALHGGMLRWFEPLEAALGQAPPFLTLVGSLGRLFAQAMVPPAAPAFDGRWYIEAHPFRIDTAAGVGRPTPEGAHRDGVAFVAVVLVNRVGVHGGETRVFQAEGPHGVRFTLTEPWSALLLDDTRVVHESTPIQPQTEGGHRDTLVITYRTDGFQDPPAS